MAIHPGQPPLSLTGQPVLSALLARRSIGRLLEPAPDQAQWQQIIATALAAPDHKKLRPWRFLLVRGAAREKMGQILGASLARQGRDAAAVERASALPLRAPAILIPVLRYQAHPDVPQIEQWLSLGAAVENLLLAIEALGFAAIWRSGAFAFDRQVMTELGLQDNEFLGGFVYVGTAAAPVAERILPPIADHFQIWGEA